LAGILTRPWIGQPRSRFSISSKANVRTGSEVNQFSCSVGTGAVSSGVKRVEREVGHLLPSSAEITWSCIFALRKSSLDDAQVSAERNLSLDYLRYVDMKEISLKR
jgi:hypothetical protein